MNAVIICCGHFFKKIFRNFPLFPGSLSECGHNLLRTLFPDFMFSAPGSHDAPAETFKKFSGIYPPCLPLHNIKLTGVGDSPRPVDRLVMLFLIFEQSYILNSFKMLLIESRNTKIFCNRSGGNKNISEFNNLIFSL